MTWICICASPPQRRRQNRGNQATSEYNRKRNKLASLSISQGGPMDSTHAVTDRLAEFIVGSRWQDIPPPVRREAMRSILNFVGCALGGSQDEAGGVAAGGLTPFFRPAQGGGVGPRERAGGLPAAFPDPRRAQGR